MSDENNTQAAPPTYDPNDPLDRIALESLRGEQEADQAAQDAANPPPEDHGIDPAQTWAQIPFMLGKAIVMGLPELDGVYNEQACLQWGAGMAAVSEKYGWDAANTFAKFGPEIMLIMATVPLAVPTFHAIKERKRKADADAARKQAEARPMHDVNAPPAPPGQQQPGNFVDPS